MSALHSKGMDSSSADKPFIGTEIHTPAPHGLCMMTAADLSPVLVQCLLMAS